MTLSDIRTPGFQTLIDDLTETMRDYGGVGIAAPQVSVSAQVFLIEVTDNNSRYPGRPSHPLTIFINPVVTPVGDREIFSPEGCLSIDTMRGVAARYGRIHVSAFDRNARRIELDLEEFPAIVVQHEMDHLLGHLYVDRLWNQAALGFEYDTDRYDSLTREYLESLQLGDLPELNRC